MHDPVAVEVFMGGGVDVELAVGFQTGFLYGPVVLLVTGGHLVLSHVLFQEQFGNQEGKVGGGAVYGDGSTLSTRYLHFEQEVHLSAL